MTTTLENNVQTSEDDGHLIAGRYRTLDRIGHGRLGEIFAATDVSCEETGVEQDLAILIVSESVVRNNKLFNKLNLGYSELRASSHPNIVDIIRFGRYGKFGYLAMELLYGASLRLVLDHAKTLPLEEVRPVIRGVGEALRFLHARDIIHGNLTTNNVFITNEYEVRLLDVLPVDPAETLVRGIVTSDLFGRCTVKDDVFGLACLAYEMLSGKHPFNHNSPAEARLADLEAERIESLPDREWGALHLALSLSDKQKMSSVDDFMHEFGIQGTETVQPPKIQPVALAPTNLTATPIAVVESAATIDNRPSNVDQVPKGNHPLRTVALGMLLAGLSAWSFFGQPEGDVVNLLSYLDERTHVEPTEPSEGLIANLETELEPEPVPEPEPIAVAAELTGDAETNIAALGFVVSVSEGDGAARITPPRTAKSDTPLIWWTSEHTATADKDYISIAQESIADASFDESSTLYVPLVDDSLSEPQESFFVSIGRFDSQRGQVDRIAAIRVDIIDDDLP